MSDEQQNKHTQEEEIDLLELALKVWAERRWILKCCGYAVIVGLVIAFSIPKEYTTSVMIAPEASDNKGGGLSSLASLAGINLNTSSGSDAIYPDLYPDIVSSTPFVTGLFDVPVRDMDGEINTTLYDYMDEYQRMPWWSYIISAPFKALSWTISLFKESEEEVDKLDPFQLTKEQTDIVKALSDHIGVSVDKKTGVTTISVTMQDPRISACLTDTVVNRLQSYIIDYRTNKARKDFHFQEKLFERKKKEYEQAQENYAKFADANKNIILQSYRAEQVRLENEMNLAYQVYTSVAQQLQMAEAKVQELTPVYTIVADMNASAVGMQYADRALVVSTMDLDMLKQYALELDIDGILTTSDAPVNIVASISEEFGLPAMSSNVASICTNKYLQRKLFRENQILTPSFYLCNQSTELSSFCDFPYVVKPVDSSASRGVQLVNGMEELRKAFENAMLYSRHHQVLIEDFIVGREFSVETFTQNNETSIVAITEKMVIGEKQGYFVEDTHIEPARISEQEYKLIADTVLNAIKLIGLDNCPSHTEVKLNDTGAYIIEIACRLGGDYITSDLVPLSTGVDMLGNLINCSLGMPIDIVHKYHKCSAIQFLNTLNYERCVNFVKSSYSLAVVRYDIKPYSDAVIMSSLDRLGYIILQTDTMGKMEEILRMIK